MSTPPPYVVQNTWFQCCLKGGTPKAKITSVTLIPVRSMQFEPDLSNLVNDPHRNERVVQTVLRAHLLNTAAASKTETQISCTLKDQKPKQASFNDKGVAELSLMIEGIGGPLEVKAVDENGKETFSQPFAVVMEKLTLTSTLQDWESYLDSDTTGGTAWPLSWWKDMGKKDKTISFSVGLAGGEKPTVAVPLKCRLVYSDGLVVPNQKLLSVRSPHPELTERRPVCLINFRVEDVSKNHQSKAFIVVVESSRESDWLKIAPCCTFPVQVKSKINKKRRGGPNGLGDDDDSAGGVKKNPRTLQTPDVPPELLTALSSSLAHDLAKNSHERSQIDNELFNLFEESKKIHEKTKSALDRLSRLSRERHLLESQFSDLIARCGFQPPDMMMISGGAGGANIAVPSTSMSSAPGFPAFPQISTSSSAGAAAAAAQNSLSGGPVMREITFGNSTSSAIVLGGDDGGNALNSSAIYLPSGNFVRLSTGDLFSLAANVTSNAALPTHSLSSVHDLARRMSSLSGGNLAGLGALQESDGEDSDDEGGGCAPPMCAYVKPEPVAMGSGEKRWLAFSESLKLLGFFLEDGSYVEVSTKMDSRWIERQEQGVQIDNLRRIEPVTEDNKLIDQVMAIMRE